jgi:hypothetical protein
MLKLIRMASLVAASMILSAAANASPSCSPSYAHGYGALADGRAFHRQVVVDSRTRWVNVTEGEVIRFVVRAQSGEETSFTWDFDTWGGRAADLGCLAPAGMSAPHIKVYIDLDQRLHGS